jgi:hypothetical protein
MRVNESMLLSDMHWLSPIRPNAKARGRAKAVCGFCSRWKVGGLFYFSGGNIFFMVHCMSQKTIWY